MTRAPDDDPSGIATYSQAGAQFGFHLLWTMVLTYPLMTAVQLISAHIGRVTGCGLAKNMGEILPRWLVTPVCTRYHRHGIAGCARAAGSAAYAIGESRGWKCGLEHKPWEAVGFYVVIGLATFLGIAIDWSPPDPIKALFYSAVINGFVAVPIMAAVMVVVSRGSAMGKFTARPRHLFFGWAATGVMAAAAIAMLVV